MLRDAPAVVAGRRPSQIGTGTRLLAGPGALDAWAAQLPPGTVTLVDDAAATVGDDVADRLAPGRTLRRWSISDPLAARDLGAAAELAGRLRAEQPSTVVAAGGGTVLDLVVLAAAIAGQPGLTGHLERQARRCGLVTVAERTRRFPSRLVAVPTTLGTGAEVSSVACVDIGGRHHLLLGEALRYDEAVIDARATRGLSDRSLARGAFEAFVRTVGCLVGGGSSLRLADIEAHGIAVTLAETLGGAAESGWDDDRRLTAACSSAATHLGWALRGRDPYPSPLWYVANELADVLAVPKVTATLALFAPWLSRVATEDRRWGAVERWRDLRERIPVLPDPAEVREAPGAAVGRWLADWGLRDLPAIAGGADVADEVARRAEQAWGGRLPMLGRFSRAELAEMVGEALRSHPAGHLGDDDNAVGKGDFDGDRLLAHA